jgi:hypothetical protein
MPLSSASIFAATVPVFAIVALGLILRRRGSLAPAADRSILFLTITLTYPAYILRKILGDPALHDFANIWIPAACGVGFMLLGMGISWLVGPLFGLKNRKERGTFAVACSVQNYGYIPIPILAVLFPDHGWAGILFVYTLGIELVMWTVGMMLISGSARGAARHLLNPVVLSIVIGVTLNLLNLDKYIPEWFGKLMEMLGNCSFPLGLMMFGIALADLLKEPGWHREWRTPVGAVILRLAVLPATMIFITLWLAPGDHFRHIVAVQASMPAAMFPLVMAKRYGGDEPTAMRVILFTTIVSFATIPFVVQAALKWLGVGS